MKATEATANEFGYIPLFGNLYFKFIPLLNLETRIFMGRISSTRPPPLMVKNSIEEEWYYRMKWVNFSILWILITDPILGDLEWVIVLGKNNTVTSWKKQGKGEVYGGILRLNGNVEGTTYVCQTDGCVNSEIFSEKIFSLSY